jgi:AraC-like DNA-binding protein
MPSGRPFIGNITSAIEANLWRPFTLDDLADTMSCSKTMLQTVFSAEDLRFSDIQRHLRANRAIEQLQAGKVRTAAGAAQRVALSESQLCRILKVEVGMTTGQLIRAVWLLNRSMKWRKELQPRAGTRFYWKRRRAWERIEAELVELLAHVDEQHPMAEWAMSARSGVKRPDYRLQGPRAEQAAIRARRRGPGTTTPNARRPGR